MQGFKMYIKYTMKDIRACIFARVFSGVLMKTRFFLVLFLALVALFTILGTADLFSGENRILLPIMLASVFFLVAITFLPGILLYLTYMISSKENRLINILQCFDILDDRITITSKSGCFTLLWSDVHKISELKPCFIIYSSSSKAFLIPRRCFENQEQLGLFINILKDHVDIKKLKLKGYRLKKSMPDSEKPFDAELVGESEPAGQFDLVDQNWKEADSSGDNPILELQFSLTERDLLSFNFRVYYTSPTGLIFTGIGALFLFGYIRNLVEYGYNPIGGLLIGLSFVFISPLSILLRIHRQFKSHLPIDFLRIIIILTIRLVQADISGLIM
jgi:hypothetical protein